MRALFLLLLTATALSACGDADPAVVSDAAVVADDATPSGSAVAAADATPDDAAAARASADAATDAPPKPAATAASTTPAATSGPNPKGPTTEECRTGPAADTAEGELYGTVPEQTFAFTSSAYGAGCFVTGAFRDQARSEGLTGDPYLFIVTDATADRSTPLEFAEDAPPEPFTLAAVGFADLNGDGERDVVVVGDDCDSFAWVALGERWEHMPPHSGKAGLESCTVAEAKTDFRALFAEPVSP